MYLVSQGGVAVCEATCFAEPILIYTKGAAINLYQIIMSRRLPFSFIATSNDCYKMRSNLLSGEIVVRYDQSEIEMFRDEKTHLKKKMKKGSTSKSIELFSVPRDEFLELCDLFPESKVLLQDYSI